MVGVRVTLSNPESGAVRNTATDETGQFRFLALPIGVYGLRLTQQAFLSVEVRPFSVSVGQTVTQRLVMSPSQVVEKLVVREETEVLETTATSASVALGGDRIEEAPAQNRNYLNFVLTAPGVAVSSGSNSQRSFAGTRSANGDSGFTFAGMRGRNNSISIDGVDNRDETTGGNRVAVGLEMVAEFRVSGTSVGAEFGGAAGGIVNMVTHSGSNTWHGDWTFFTQNELANARNPEDALPDKNRFRRYQPGVSVNGPVKRDRTFFSTSFEQQWESGQEWSEVPRTALTPIRSVLGTPAFARAAIQDPLRGLFDTGSRNTEFAFKGNHLLTAANNLGARYAFSRGRESHDVQSVDDFTERSARGSSLTSDHSLVLEWTSILSPHLVNDLRGQISWRTVGLTPNARGAMLEIPGVVTLGQSIKLDAERTESHQEVVESLNWTRGKHQVAAGASVHRVDLDSRMANRFAGAYVFPNLASFLAGQPDVFFQAFGDPHTNLWTIPVGLWLQERYQATPTLSLETGLRYDYQPLPSGLPHSGRNFAPRAGVAWRPLPKRALVVRAGFGLFYDRFPLAYLNEAIQKDGVHGFEQYLTGDAAVRMFQIALGGTATGPLPGIPVSVYRPGTNLQTTYGKKLSTGVEGSLSQNTTLGVEYTWMRGYHLPRIRNAALTVPPLYQLEQDSNSAYQGASVSLNRRLSHEFALLASYTLSRTHDDSSDYDEQPMNPANWAADYARSRQYQKHRASVSSVFEIPDELLGHLPRGLNQTLESITIAPIFTAGSGRPLNALETSDVFRTGAYPLSARPFGLPRNAYFTKPNLQLDLRVMKTILVYHDRAKLQFGVESFNLTNHSNPLRQSAFLAAQGERLNSFSHTVETLNARQVQFMIQLEY